MTMLNNEIARAQRDTSQHTCSVFRRADNFAFILSRYRRLLTVCHIALVVDGNYAHILYRSSPKSSMPVMVCPPKKCEADESLEINIKATKQLVRNVSKEPPQGFQ